VATIYVVSGEGECVDGNPCILHSYQKTHRENVRKKCSSDS
jgi:hypothetical protein